MMGVTGADIKNDFSMLCLMYNQCGELMRLAEEKTSVGDVAGAVEAHVYALKQFIQMGDQAKKLGQDIDAFVGEAGEAKTDGTGGMMHRVAAAIDARVPDGHWWLALVSTFNGMVEDPKLQCVSNLDRDGLIQAAKAWLFAMGEKEAWMDRVT